MKKTGIIIAIMLITVMTLTSAFTVSANAAAVDPLAEVNIHGSHRLASNESIDPYDCTFVLTAKGDAPMPDGSLEGQTKTVTIKSNSDFNFGTMSYYKPGIYEYTVTREVQKRTNFTMDESVYHVSVAIYNDGEILTVITQNDETGKTDAIKYVDKYIKPTPKDEKQTGDSTMYPIMAGLAFLALVSIILSIVIKRKEDR